MVAGPADLEPLTFCSAPPTKEEAIQFKSGSQAAVDLARRGDLLLAGGWGVGADLIGWICGLENMVFMVYDQPDFFRPAGADRPLEPGAGWSRALCRDRPVHQRAWYENLDFFTPASWKKYLFPILKAEADLAHSFGSKFGYLITSSCMPLLDSIVEAGVDVLIGVDPQHWDLQLAKEKLAGRVGLWGGVNGASPWSRGAWRRFGAKSSVRWRSSHRVGDLPLAGGQRP